MELHIHFVGHFCTVLPLSKCENVTANARQVVCHFKISCCLNVLFLDG